MAYANTDHLFSQPVRYYKANDPYYYEVDNIPIRQLEENVLWVKDQVDSLLTPGEGEPETGSPLFVGDDLDLEYIKQFRPKFTGARNITVQPGRFMARVNDAHNVADSLAQITSSWEASANECVNEPKLSISETASFFDAVWASYTSKLTSTSFGNCPGESNLAAAYRANGLETMYTFYINSQFQNFGFPIPTATDNTSHRAPEYLQDGTGRGRTWPALWHCNIDNSFGSIGAGGFDNLATIHLKIVQHWRGVIRTAVADFRGETIEIAPFDRYDYWYAEDVGNIESRTSLEDLASQRIDLLVIYTHPIDASATVLSEYDGVSPFEGSYPGIGDPQRITSPRLGVIRGAGIGVKRTRDDRIELLDKRTAPGQQKILANLNDHLIGESNTGIKLRNGSIVHGSFPSPDDLANIAPNLTLGLADNDLQLIGQTALPIAYVVVSKGSDSLAQEDIIDIRPFFRTAELSYNERAGIAAATPPLSLANPAVGAAEIKNIASCIKGQTDDAIAAIPAHTSLPHALVDADAPAFQMQSSTGHGITGVISNNDQFRLGETVIAMGSGWVDWYLTDSNGFPTAGTPAAGAIGSNSLKTFDDFGIPIVGLDLGDLTTVALISEKYAVHCFGGLDSSMRQGANDDNAEFALRCNGVWKVVNDPATGVPTMTVRFAAQYRDQSALMAHATVILVSKGL